ncbi:3050_t:CDS:2, partial [Racocetra persica]
MSKEQNKQGKSKKAKVQKTSKRAIAERQKQESENAENKRKSNSRKAKARKRKCRKQAKEQQQKGNAENKKTENKRKNNNINKQESKSRTSERANRKKSKTKARKRQNKEQAKGQAAKRQAAKRQAKQTAKKKAKKAQKGKQKGKKKQKTNEGITFIYWIISLHKAPLPYPRIIILTRDVIFGYSFEVYKPDGIFICAQNDWVYLTAIWKGYESDFDDATGLIKQYRRPLRLLLSSNNFDPNNKWQLLYIHRLEGPITHISSYYHENYQFTPNHDFDENNALAVLYQKQEQEQIQYVLRLYNIGKFESGSSDFDYVECKKPFYTCHNYPSFEYQDIILPGTTKIKSFHVEDSLILYSRNPDNAKFRTIQIPRNIFEIGKRKDEALVVKSSESGPTQ